MDEITLAVAHRLFDEARAYSSGRMRFVAETSEIRRIARLVFGVANVTHLQHVCDYVFYVIACDDMGVKP